MQNMMTIKEAAEIWGISTRRILKLCSEGRIPDAVKDGKWLIPVDAIKPKDKRVKTGEFIKAKRDDNLPLPIGVSDYRKAVTDYYYVDKTLLIKEFLDERAQVSLFTRPRRFGKTLNMDMLKTFFELTEEDTSSYFVDKKIWTCGRKYRDYQGKYPVIFISFKDIKHKNWEDSLRNIAAVISGEFLRHKEVYESIKVNEFDKEYYRKVAAQEADEVELGQSLLILSRMLDEHYGIAPVIIIDEYDTPIQQGYTAGFYEQAVSFMRNFFSGGLKDNAHLSYGFMTGILRVPKESFYHGFVLGLCAVMDNRYEITSNREAGDGRFDICLKPRVPHLPGILIELKAANNQNGLKELAKDAVRQIENRRYSSVLEEAGITSVLKYGVAFFGKFVEVELV